MMRWLLLILCALLLSGCTYVQIGGARYLSVAQRKDLVLVVDDAGRVRELRYSTAGDPALATIRDLAAGAAKGAM